MSNPAEAPLLVVVGPTASGKTALAVRLSELSAGEIISADSVQVYKYFDIGSAKPTPDELRRARHHLVDMVEPESSLEAAQWAKAAEDAIETLRARGVRPVICGGTFLWIRALLYGLAAAPPADPMVRAQHQQTAEQYGRRVLHERLACVDPASAARLHPNDFVRVSRALEVFELSGRRLSDLQAEHGFRALRHRALLVGIRRSAEELNVRLEKRCRDMFLAGWVDEVRQLLSLGYGATRPMGAVGYRQIGQALQGSVDLADSGSLRDLESQVLRATRVFARRQRTWLRDQPVHWLDPQRAASDAELQRLLALSP